jgi:uncharacterized protein
MKHAKEGGTILLGLVLLLGAAALVYPRDTVSDYVAPLQQIPRGRAPGMRVQLLSDENQNKQYAVIFSQGDDAFSGLLDFADKFHVSGAHFTAMERWMD